MISPLTKALAGAVLLLVALCSYLGLRLNYVKNANTGVRSALSFCQDINGGQREAIGMLQTRNSELVSKNAADLASGQAAAARYLELEGQYNSLEQENEALREKLAQDDPQMGKWLASGMDHRVACSLWPRNAACKN